MRTLDEAIQEQRDIENALRALRAAQMKFRADGRSGEFVRGRQLMRADARGEQVIKTLPERPKMTVQTKYSRH